jgi:adenosylcobyric acid synthase
MLGARIEDPGGLEGGGAASGLGLLPLHTRLGLEKTVVRAEATRLASPPFGLPAGAASLPRGYEIHLGTTERAPGCAPLLRLRREGRKDEVDDGAVSADGATAGSYLHGLLDDDGFRHALVGAWRRASGLSPASRFAGWTRERGARFDRLADHVRAALDVPALSSWITRSEAPGRRLVGSGAC